MKQNIYKILVFFRLDFLLLFFPNRGYLYEKGWLISYLKKRPLNRNRQPIPWLSYGIIELLEERLTKDLNVFEFGSGGSTLWLASRVNKIYSVESDDQWYNSIKLALPSNVDYFFERVPKMTYQEAVYRELGMGFENYSDKIKTLPLLFDLVLIDGIDRLNSIYSAIEKVSPKGVIIVDNCEYEEQMKPGIDLLNKAQFRMLKFPGLAPGIPWTVKTVIFYRSNNCLGI